MENHARIRINLQQGEFEIEGSESFVNTYADTVQNFVALMKQRSEEGGYGEDPDNEEPDHENVGQLTLDYESAFQRRGDPLQIPETFAEFYRRVPREINDIDKILMGGHFIQHSNGTNMFTTREVSSLLKEHGIKLTNPSHSIKLNLDASRIFTVKKGQFRVSETGMERLHSIVR